MHTVRSHTIPKGPSGPGKPRSPGEYVISNQNGIGIDIARVTKVLGKRFLTPVRKIGINDVLATIQNNEVHDTFIQNDPLDDRTYLYNAAGFSTGFNVYDITDPGRISQVAEWDLTPECEEDWYAHTIDVTHRDGKRFVTMPLGDAADGRQERAQRAGGDVPRPTRTPAVAPSSATATSPARCGSSTRRTSPSSARRTTRSPPRSRGRRTPR